MKEKTRVLYVAALLLVSLFGVMSASSNVPYAGMSEGLDDIFAGGSGTADDPYLIEDVHQLQAMKRNITAHYALANDIDASETKEWNDGVGFEPVGTGPHLLPNVTFTGSFDGRNYTITGLYIDRPDTYYIGLFGVVGTDGEVRNVGVVYADVSGDESVGALMGGNRGTVENSYATGSVTGNHVVGGLMGESRGEEGMVSNSHSLVYVNGDSVVGGLVGQNWGSIVSNSYATGAVNGGSYVMGGLVGSNFEGTVEHSYATGNVGGDSIVGGLVGHNSGGLVSNSYATGIVNGNRTAGALVGDNKGIVYNSYANGDVSASERVGGLVGSNDGIISNSYSTGDVNGDSDVGGLVGEHYRTIFNSYATADVSGNDRVGGLVGQNSHGTVLNSYANGEVSGNENVGGLVGSNNAFVDHLDGSIVENSLATGAVVGVENVGGLVGYNAKRTEVRNSFSDRVTTGYADAIGLNNGTVENVHPLSTEEMMDTETYVAAKWTIIDIPDEGVRDRRYRWNIVNGEGYPLLNLGELESLPISNWHELNMIRYDLEGNYHLVDDLDENTDGYRDYNDRETSGWKPIGRSKAYFRGRFDGNNYTINGLYIHRPEMSNVGLFGIASDALLMNINLLDNDVTGNISVGVLVGYNYGGWEGGTVSNAYAKGNVSGVENVGGLVGHNRGINSIVKDSCAIGTISGNKNVGGLVGFNYGGWRGGCIVSGSYSMTNVSGREKVGGLVGWNIGGNISDSYAMGSVSGEIDTGGLVGDNGLVGHIDRGGVVTNTYAVVNVTGEENVGGLIGHNPEGADVRDSFVDGEISGQEQAVGMNNGTVENVHSLSTNEMKDKSTYAGWDFENIWSIDEGRNNGYPYLQWQRYEEVDDQESSLCFLTLLLLAVAILILLLFVLKYKRNDIDDGPRKEEIENDLQRGELRSEKRV